MLAGQLFKAVLYVKLVLVHFGSHVNVFLDKSEKQILQKRRDFLQKHAKIDQAK